MKREKGKQVVNSQMINMNDSLLSKFLNFIRSPSYFSNSPKRSFTGKLFDIARLYSLLYFFAILSGILIYLATLITNYDLNQNAVVDLVNNAPVLLVIFLAVVNAPITEELTFRLLLRFSHKKLAIAASFILLFILGLFIEEIYIEVLLPLLIIFGLFVFFLSRRFINKAKAEEFYRKNMRKIFYFSIFAFAVIHINNYFDLGPLILLIPIFVLPQFFAGLFLGYIRLNYGFMWTILTHAAYNLLTLIPFILFSFGSESLRAGSDASAEFISDLPQGDLIILAILGFGVILVFLIFLALIIQMLVEYWSKRSKLLK